LSAVAESGARAKEDSTPTVGSIIRAQRTFVERLQKQYRQRSKFDIDKLQETGIEDTWALKEKSDSYIVFSRAKNGFKML
jgi:hypothetical protein